MAQVASLRRMTIAITPTIAAAAAAAVWWRNYDLEMELGHIL